MIRIPLITGLFADPNAADSWTILWEQRLRAALAPLAAVEVVRFSHAQHGVIRAAFREWLTAGDWLFPIGHSLGGAAICDACWWLCNVASPEYVPLPYGAIIRHATLLDPVPDLQLGQVGVISLPAMVRSAKAYVRNFNGEPEPSAPVADRPDSVRDNQWCNLTHGGITVSEEIIADAIKRIQGAAGVV